MDKYQPLREAGTNAANYEMGTDDVIEHLKQWDKAYGIELSEVTFDTVVVSFDRLPNDVLPLAEDIYEFCPDTIDQHFGCFKEMLEHSEETGESVPNELSQLIEGVDMDDENYGLELLKRSLVKNKKVMLWWD